MVSQSSELWRESNRAGVQFLLTQLEIGRTFLELAGQARFPEVRRRHLLHVHAIYTNVRRLVGHVTPASYEQEQIEHALEQIARALLDAGLVAAS